MRGLRNLLLAVVALSIIAGCENEKELDLVSLSQITFDQLEICLDNRGSYYEHECEGRTGVYYAVIGGHFSSGVAMKLSESCSPNTPSVRVDAENLGYEYAKSYEGQCVHIVAEIGSRNMFTPDVRVLHTIGKVSDVEIKKMLQDEEEAEVARLRSLTPTLIVECTSRKGWKAFLQHLDGYATFVKPVNNPAQGYNPIARRISILTNNDLGFWYDGQQLTKQFNVSLIWGYRGFGDAKFDKRDKTLSFPVINWDSVKKKEVGTLSINQIYQCNTISRERFDNIVDKFSASYT